MTKVWKMSTLYLLFQVLSAERSAASSSPQAVADVQDAEGMNGKLLEAAQKEAEKVIMRSRGALKYILSSRRIICFSLRAFSTGIQGSSYYGSRKPVENGENFEVLLKYDFSLSASILAELLIFRTI